MNQQDIIQKTAEYIKQEFSDDSSGHDWWHIYRVWKNAITLCEHESADQFIVELAALLHDLDDWKFNESGDETPLRARAWLESCSVDNGIGIKREDIKHIFERFYRVHTGNVHNVKGFGLGLHYVEEIVRAHGGRVAVSSELGKGSTFTLDLPVS